MNIYKNMMVITVKVGSEVKQSYKIANDKYSGPSADPEQLI